MIKGPAVRASQGLFHVRLGDHLIHTFGDRELAALQSALALLRTVFEDHYVDPDHQSCLFFHGGTISGAQGQAEDFTVVHRDGRVILSEFTGPRKGPAMVSLPLYKYAGEVVRFAETVLARPARVTDLPDWQKDYVQSRRESLAALAAVGRRFVESGEHEDYQTYCEEFMNLHGRLKRPLSLQVVNVLGECAPFKPVTVEARVVFGPIRAGEVLPLRLNRGDVVRATATDFTSTGVVLMLEGVGSGGVCRGDLLFGLQLFYP